MKISAAVTAVVAGIALMAALVIHRHSQAQPAPMVSNTDSSSSVESGEDVTVLLDFSASFAPYRQNDLLALKWISGALEELATKWWKPPVTIVWRRIGTSSLLSPPICPVVEFSPKLTDGGKRAQAFKNDISACLAAASQQKGRGEPFTDIAGAVAAAVKSREFSAARKILIIFSDFKEDQAPATRPATFELNGETVVMLHRPGTDETKMSEYLTRIEQWKDLLKQRGAGRIVSFPLALVTHTDLVHFMMADAEPSGTSATILVDFKDQFTLGKNDDAGDVQYLYTLARSVARMAGNWQPPVTIRLGAIGRSALHMRWMPPQVFQQTMVQVSNPNGPEGAPVRKVEDLEMGIDESIRGLRQFSEGASDADLIGAISLVQSGSGIQKHGSYLFIVSDFVDASGLPANLQTSLRGTHVLMVYRPALKDRADANGFFARVQDWKQFFLRSGAQSVCEAEMATLTEHTIRQCLRMD